MNSESDLNSSSNSINDQENMEEMKSEFSEFKEYSQTATEIPQKDKFVALPISFIPGLPTSERILSGEQIPFKLHVRDILKYYDVIPVSPSFIQGVEIPNNTGNFFLVKPESNGWWEKKAEENKHLSDFIRGHQKSNKNSI